MHVNVKINGRKAHGAPFKAEKPWFARGWFHLCIWSLSMLGIVIGAWITGKPIPDGAVLLYGVVLGAYTANKTIVKSKDQELELIGKRK